MSKQSFTSNPTLPFSDVVVQGNVAFVSGQVGFVEAGKLAEGGVEAQTRATLENLKLVLEQAALKLENVVRTGCYLVNKEDMPGFNKVYSEYFTADKPARSTIFVAGLPVEDCLVEIDIVVAVE